MPLNPRLPQEITRHTISESSGLYHEVFFEAAFLLPVEPLVSLEQRTFVKYGQEKW